MKEWDYFTFNINGFETKCKYTKHVIDDIFRPLLKHLEKMQEEKKERIIVFLAAPPAVGKSTIVTFLEYLSSKEGITAKVQAIGLDGFHYHTDYINTHTALVNGVQRHMKDVKGCPETFDIDKLKETLAMIKTKNITWPVYDRNLHDVIEDAVTVTGDIILIEGNWLLLDEGKWADVKDFCDYSIRICCEETILKDRLINRKIQGGLTRKEAEEFYAASDRMNVKRALEHSIHGELELLMEEDGDYKRLIKN